MSKRVIHLRGSGAMLGAERVVLELAKSSPRFGYEPLIVAPQAPEAAEPELVTQARQAGLRAMTLPCRGRLDWQLFRRIRELAAAEGAELIHSHGYKEDFYALLARTGLPLVATNHNWTRTTARLRLYRLLDARLLRRFDRVVSVSDPLADELTSLGIKPARLHKITNGIDFNAFRAHPAAETRAAQRRELGVAEDATAIGMVGGLRPEKGHRVALRALARLAGEFPQARLIIVGDGQEERVLRELTRTLKLEERVVFAGRRSNIGEILQSLDVFLMPSLTEGLPMALLEAMAAGLPAVASRVGDIPTTVVEGRTGYLVEPDAVDQVAKALRPLLSDATLRHQLGHNARQRVEKGFSSTAMARSYCELYDELLADVRHPVVKARMATSSIASEALLKLREQPKTRDFGSRASRPISENEQ